MEGLINGKTLLVGEGDFSFTVSMVEKLASKHHSNIIATSLESEETIKKHQHAEKNILWLKEKGVTVRLNTDATQLHASPLTRDEKFSCIIFNFPHAGGKSNHKKNRKLLNDFFASAVQVLESLGQIMMTLCKGQGGTPAERPMRAWHDSWQVVSMAANSCLILTDILPFKADSYRVYTSTGFRSLDKGFNTDNALTHVFEMAEPVGVPTAVRKAKLMLGQFVYLCPAYIYRKLKQIRFINRNRDHPIHIVYKRISQCLTASTTMNIQSLGIQGPVRLHRAPKACEKGLAPDKGSVYKLIKSENCDFDQNDNDISDLIGEKVENEIAAHDGTEVTFEYDPLNFERSDDLKNIQLMYGPVLKPCKISQNHLPVSYDVTIVWPVEIGQHGEDSKSFQDRLTDVVDSSASRFMNVLHNVISKSGLYIELMKNQYEGVIHSLSESKRSLQVANLNLCKTNFPSMGIEGLNTIQDEGKVDEHVGEMFVKIIEDQSHTSHVKVYLTVDLCKLACSKYNIEDVRLLWSCDRRVLQQFVKLKHEGNICVDKFPCEGINLDNDLAEGGQILSTIEDNKENGEEFVERLPNDHKKQAKYSVIRTASLYPMIFVHDMSFWENEYVPFNFQDYCDIIRDVADDNVIRVDLIDTYSDTKTGKISRCYRLTFQSVDKALSYNTSWKLQSLIRLEVEKKMKIVLR